MDEDLEEFDDVENAVGEDDLDEEEASVATSGEAMLTQSFDQSSPTANLNSENTNSDLPDLILDPDLTEQQRTDGNE